jgi:uroporphyrinogen-III synthase
MRVLITRPQKDAQVFARALADIGAEPAFFPTIEICPAADTSGLDRALSNLQAYDWLIFTSANAVDVILSRMAALGSGKFPDHLQVAAIGPKTAARLREAEITPDFIPDQYVAEAVMNGLGNLQDCWVLLPIADLADDTLPRAIQSANGIAHVITAYHTRPVDADPAGIAAIREGVDVITFTSGSTVRNFVTLVREAGLDPFCLPGNPIIACIGPKTAQTARQLGISVEIVAEEHTAAGLVRAISTLQKKGDPRVAF